MRGHFKWTLVALLVGNFVWANETEVLSELKTDRTVPLASAVDSALGLRGPDYWAGIPRHPAVVNPVGRESDWTWISLAGDWAFTNFPHASGKRTVVFKNQEPWPLERTMCVPGCWEAQGLGGEGMGVPHLAPDNSPRPIRGTWKGEGYYRRRVDIPASWIGKRIWLKVGGVRSRGWFYVNDRAVAMVDSYAGAWKYEITEFVTPGASAKVVAVVDNVVANRNGQPATVQRWGGLVRDVELEATPVGFIDDAWVRGNFDKRLAEVHVEVGGIKGRELGIRVTVDDEVVERAIEQSSVQTIEVPLRNFRPWSPEHPNLYWAKIDLLENGRITMTRRERFGVRKLEVRGKEFYLNGKRFFFRGFGDDSEYPITGISPSSRAYHLTHLEKARACGFNYVRLHTHCEVPEYFEAADEAGIFVQPELSYYFDEPDDYFDYDPVRDAVDRWVAFRRHPSYAINSSGNEGMLGPEAGRILYSLLKKLDPDRLVIEEDMGSAEAMNNGFSLDDRTDYCGGPLNAWPRGSYDPDRPFVCHEYMNLCVKQDSRAESGYTGVWLPPATRADRARWLARFGLTHRWGDRLQDAQHALQKYWQKNGVEHARKDPFCDGYCYWTIADCAVFNKKVGVYTAQGLFNPLWETKSCGSTPEDFAIFNSPTCVLLDTDPCRKRVKGLATVDWNIPGRPEETNRVYSVGETISADFMLAHYGEDPLVGARFEWSLMGPDGAVYARGAQPLGTCTADTVRSVLKTPIVVPAVSRPTKAVLSAAVVAGENESFRQTNAWEFWFFPRESRRMPSTRTVVCAPDAPEVAAARASGKNLILVSNQSGPSNCRLGWWWIGDQVGTAFARHEAFGDFPYEPHLSPLHFRIVHKGTVLPVEEFEEDDFIVVGEGGTDVRLYLAAKTRPNGGREVFVSGLDVTSDLPESISLFNGLLQWVENNNSGIK